jgi:hypothetical protein
MGLKNAPERVGIGYPQLRWNGDRFALAEQTDV